jgi:hypothetical protein
VGFGGLAPQPNENEDYKEPEKIQIDTPRKKRLPAKETKIPKSKSSELVPENY